MQIGGYGYLDSAWINIMCWLIWSYGSFDWTTSDSANSYVDDKGLHIVPTWPPRQPISRLIKSSTSTPWTWLLPESARLLWLKQCSRYSNITNGTIINPVRSARLTTAVKVSIKYGCVEVVAKIPKEDWLWPSLWMYPEVETYGMWPRSGEIDIAQVRGNEPSSYSGVISSPLANWWSYHTPSPSKHSISSFPYLLHFQPFRFGLPDEFISFLGIRFLTFIWKHVLTSWSYAIAAGLPLALVNYLVVGWNREFLDSFYVNSWKVMVVILILFDVIVRISLYSRLS